MHFMAAAESPAKGKFGPPGTASALFRRFPRDRGADAISNAASGGSRERPRKTKKMGRLLAEPALSVSQIAYATG